MQQMKTKLFYFIKFDETNILNAEISRNGMKSGQKVAIFSLKTVKLRQFWRHLLIHLSMNDKSYAEVRNEKCQNMPP